MKVNKKLVFLFILSLPLLFLPACTETQGQVGVLTQSESAVRTDLQMSKQQNIQDLIAQRFQEPTLQGRSPVESAIELSEKYAQLSDEVVTLREKGNHLVDENNRLKGQMGVLNADLKKAEQELVEANNLLIDMRIEVNNWKMDVLGFRDEIRQAETAQLEALLKILKILGGQVVSETTQSETQNAVTALSAKANQPQTK
ncbi:MAG: hypothetical protein A2173_08655 [Planctomycetes bacterium RBG_13_44_8b]|nr:MAG: hypothetical protein A2173_08655 [Planctomycetes bacterium RBG_13_44_8b]